MSTSDPNINEMPRDPRHEQLCAYLMGEGTPSERLELGYMDFPPAIAWLTAAVTATLGESLYAELDERDAIFDGPAMLRRAQLEIRERHPELDWTAFRAVVP